MTGSIPVPGKASQRFTPQQRMERLGSLDPNQMLEAFAALISFNPDAFDAVLDLTDPPARNDDPDLAPFCSACGGPLGLFPKWGLTWRHYTGHGDSGLDNIQVTEPDHEPVLAWRAGDQ